WAVSSAVAHGGIPADAARAWAHIQGIFHAVGARNVGWVWSPADPAHDQLYAPPPSTIDVVLLSLISYPHTKWATPSAAIAATRVRYPNKPLIVEVSAAGAPQQKAQWLTQVGQAVHRNGGVFALIYHEGSPDITATDAVNQSWSLTSDPASLRAMRAVVGTLTPSKSTNPPARNLPHNQPIAEHKSILNVAP
nr:hypothetical protein [Ktedonobacterales bacterium]